MTGSHPENVFQIAPFENINFLTSIDGPFVLNNMVHKSYENILCKKAARKKQ